MRLIETNAMETIKGISIRESITLKVSVSLLVALLINALLLALIQLLVTASRGAIPGFEEMHRVEFVRLKPQPKPKEPPPEEPKVQQEKQEPPVETFEDVIPTPERQSPPKPEAPRFDLDLRASLSAGPYLGDFEPESPAADLDAGQPSLQIPPVYPPRAKRMGLEGRVTVEFTITTDGSVDDAKIVEAEPPGVFDRAVLRAIRRWKFSPRQVNGRAVERRARKQIVFKLEKS